MLGSSVATIVIFIPFVLMSGVAGAYFKVMTNTMIITLICSFLVTWIGLPVIYLMLTRNHLGHASNAKEEVHTVKKQKWVSFFILRPLMSIIIVATLIVVIVLIPSK